MLASDLPRRDGPVVITGGAGFIGCNLADRVLTLGRPVRILDSFAREGVEWNARWLTERHGARVEIRRADVRDAETVGRALRDASAVFHFAAQVAVTSSLEDARHDFEVNAGGTLNVLEELRRLENPPPFVFTSTNKVYGELADLALTPRGRRYEPAAPEIRARGVDETRPLDFLTPYGCSKGTADQYTQDFARSYGLDTVVFRMSCIYGPRQWGTEDQGWLAHLAVRAMQELPITIYGDGMQVRDVLFVEDLVEALLLAWSHAPRLRGRAFNIGGGPERTLSLLELTDLLAALLGRAPELRFDSWRRGDQRYYVSNTGAYRNETGWFPRVGVEDGVRRLTLALRERAETPEPVR